MVKFLKDWAIPIIIGVIIALTFNFVVQVVNVDGPSMEPNLQDGQKVLALKMAKISRGSVIVFDARKEDPGIKSGQKYYVKRVVAIPGDTIRSEDGKLYVNGKAVDQYWISTNEKTTGTGDWTLSDLENGAFRSYDPKYGTRSIWDDGKEHKIPAGQYFALGDHRSVSEDSRYFGWVDKKHVLGVVYSFPWSTRHTDVNDAWKKYFVNN